MLTFAQIRSTVSEHITAAGQAIDGEIHKAIHAFVDFVERKDKDLNDAVTLLRANGYIVAAPAAVPTDAAQAAQS